MQGLLYLFLLNLGICLITSNQASAKVSMEDVKESIGCTNPLDCKFMERDIRRDSKQCLQHPEEVFELAQRWPSTENPLSINGSIRYLGLFPKKYHYRISRDSAGKVHVTTSIHFRDASPKLLANLKTKMKEAERIWEMYTPEDLEIDFHFNVVESKQEADYSVHLKSRTRGPYDTAWDPNWRPLSMAHELGHMMGLDDEYKNRPGGGDSSKCFRYSLMCSSGDPAASPRKYYYYLILRRAYCA